MLSQDKVERMLSLFRLGEKRRKVAEGEVGRNVAARMEKPSAD